MSSATLAGDSAHPASRKSSHETSPKEPLHSDDAAPIPDVVSELSPPAGGTAPAQPRGHPPPTQMSRARFIIVFASLMTCVFLFALDQLIISTAVPKIVSQFDALTQVAWLSTGFFITLCAFTLLYSQFLAVFPSKYVLLSSVFIFTVGSALCGAAPNMDVLILGRFVAGIGAAGIFSSCFMVTIEITSLQERSTYLGLFGACFGLASVLGPLVGGAFTDHLSWRWCFYINLPISAVAFAMVVIFLKKRDALGARKDDHRSLFQKLIQMDWVATALAMSATVCISLAFEYGGVTKPWDSAAVIVLLIMIPVSFAALFLWTLWLGPKRAMIPLSLYKRRTIIGAAATSTFGWMAFMAVVQWLAVSFQAVNGQSATRAGVSLFSFIITQTVIIVLMGKLVAKTGRYKYLIIIGPLMMALGCGLLYGTNSLKHLSHVLGFQVFLGVGVACFLQNTMVATQVELAKEPHLMSRGVGSVNFFGFIGRILGISISTSIFNQQLRSNLTRYAPTLPEHIVPVVRDSIAAIRTLVPKDLQPAVIEAYRVSISPIFLFALTACVIAAACACLIKNDTTIAPKHPAGEPQAGESQAAAPAPAGAHSSSESNAEKGEVKPAA